MIGVIMIRLTMIRVMLGILGAASLIAADAVRVLQTNSAGDNIHVIDPATNQVVGVIEDIEVPHGAAIAPDGSRILRLRRSIEDARCGGRRKSQGHQTDSAERVPE